MDNRKGQPLLIIALAVAVLLVLSLCPWSKWTGGTVKDFNLLADLFPSESTDAPAQAAEIIDPDTGEVLPEGSQGERVFTSITKEAFPLLRYRTRDICMLTREKCSCGRTHVKMCKPMGRSDDMLIVKGVNVFPSQIETVLLEQGYPANYQIIVDRVNNSDTIEVMVEMTPENFSDNLGKITEMEKGLVSALKAMLGIYAKVRLVAPKSITRSEGKAVRVIDKRKI